MMRPMHKPKKSQEVPFEEDGGSGFFRVQGFRVFFCFRVIVKHHYGAI